MPISELVRTQMSGASWIRRMFEQGLEMKRRFGERNVFDLTLGNPVIEPPSRFRERLVEVVTDEAPGTHRYMPNVGYESTRRAVADSLSREWGLDIPWSHVVMTVGAAGALNIVFQSLMNEGEEVIAIAPYFPEYRFYAENSGGSLVLVESGRDFQLDLSRVEEVLNSRTRIILLNSPNNPTGVMYPEKSLKELGDLLRRHKAKTGRAVYVVSDEPYRKIVYTMERAPSPMQFCDDVIFCTSHSKDLGIPGERIGYAVVGPGSEDAQDILAAMAFTNRTLGFVNAPALMQRVVEELQDVSVDVDIYRRKRDRLYGALVEAGYDCIEPDGAFYLFPKCPWGDDAEFVEELARQRVLAVPGSGFGWPGHFRLSYCCEDWTIEGAIPILAKMVESSGPGARAGGGAAVPRPDLGAQSGGEAHRAGIER